MAISSGHVRRAADAVRPLTATALDAIREAVVVVDAGFTDLPLVFANATARRCLVERGGSRLTDRPLHVLLGTAGVAAVDAALSALGASAPTADRVITWRFRAGDVAVSTEFKLLQSDACSRPVMLTFAEPASEPALISASELVPQDALIFDGELKITYANPGAANASGGVAAGVPGHSAVGLAPTSAVPREAFVRALSGDGSHDDAVSVATAGDQARVFSVDVQSLLRENDILGVTVLSRDVTDRRGRHGLGRMSDPQVLALTEHVRDVITVAARDGTVLYVSGAVVRALGYTPEERRANSLFDLVHPDDVAGLRARYAGLPGGGAFTEVYRYRHKDGSYRWLESHFVPALDNPLINGILVNSRDVSRRKRAESQLAQREEVFRLAADAVIGVVFEWDLARGTVHRSRGVREVLGIEPEAVAVQGMWSERVHPLDQPAYAETISRSLRSEVGWTVTYRIRDSRGRYRSMLERALVQRSAAGEPIRVIGCAVDVSESKRLADLMGEIQRTALMGGWEFNYAAQEFEWTEEMFAIFETTREEFPVSPSAILARCTPESRERLSVATIDAERGSGSLDLEVEITTMKQHRIWVRVIGRVEMLDGRPFRSFGSMQNVQARKLSQIALETSTDWLKLSMNMAHMHAWRWERADDSLKFAIVDGHMMHLPRVFPGLKKLMTRVHPRDRLGVRRAIDLAFEHHVEVREKFPLKSHDGQYRSYATVAQPLFDAANQPQGLVGVAQDVTPRREAQRQLRRSEELLRATTANTADTLILVDTDLKVRFINRGVLDLSVDRIIGEAISVLLPRSARGAVMAKLRAVLSSGQTATYEFEVKTAGSATQHFENQAVLVRDNGVGTGISIAMRDTTERRRLEQEVLECSSRERHRIGRDLHDGLGQELTGIALMLRGLAQRVKRQAPDSINEINEIVGLVNQSIETARALARGLLPVSTDNGGLSLALRALTTRCQELYGIGIEYEEELAPDTTMSESESSHLFRIAQEALTNIARHGNAGRVAVQLVLNPTDFELRIADDGWGIDPDRQTGSGMGLKIMQYRASMIGAKLDIGPNFPRGTVVRVTSEQPALMSALESSQAI